MKSMTPMRIAYTLLLCLLCAGIAYARPQQDEPKKHEEKQEQAKPEAKPEGSRQENAKPEKEAAPEKRSEQEQKSDKEMQKSNSRSEHEMNGQEQNRNSASARPAGKGGHIPDEKFRSSFGRQHTFKVSRPVVVNNQQTIVYGGYNFALADAWPGDWAYTDDVYLDYIDGEYFLFDLLHPGMRIAVFVVE